jgi:uncharacterized protein YvpB
MKIDLCPNRDDFYSQLNNEVNPYNACQVTSMIAGLDLVFRNLNPINNSANYKQPEDCLYHFICEDKNIQAFYKRSHPDSTIPAPEWADVLCYAVNQLYGIGVVRFDGNLSVVTIKEDLEKQLPVMVSMQYPDNKPKPIPGHYILVVGCDDANLLINDPYRNHLTGGADGFKNIFTPEDWKKHSKGYGIRYLR